MRHARSLNPLAGEHCGRLDVLTPRCSERPRTAKALLPDHVRLTCRSADRIFLQVYVPRLDAIAGANLP
jgi:hypothetical protein